MMHGRSRMTIDSRIPTMPGRSTYVGFSPTQADVLLPHQARSAVGCWANRMKGEPHPSKNRFLRRVFLHTDDGVNELILFSGVATSRDSNGFTT